MQRDPNSPFTVEPDGTYITVTQMRFFLNSPKGERVWHERKAAFVEYYNMCRVYNLVSAVLEIDPEAAMIYWDPIKEGISIAFPVDGSIALAISSMKLLKESDYGYDFGGGNWTI